MAGCFGQHEEDRFFALQLDKHFEAQDALARRIDAMANDMYLANLHALPLYEQRGRWLSSNLGEVLRELKDEDMHHLAVAVRNGDECGAGKEVIKMVTNYLRKQAQEQAEEKCE